MHTRCSCKADITQTKRQAHCGVPLLNISVGSSSNSFDLQAIGGRFGSSLSSLGATAACYLIANPDSCCCLWPCPCDCSISQPAGMVASESSQCAYSKTILDLLQAQSQSNDTTCGLCVPGLNPGHTLSSDAMCRQVLPAVALTRSRCATLLGFVVLELSAAAPSSLPTPPPCELSLPKKIAWGCLSLF